MPHVVGSACQPTARKRRDKLQDEIDSLRIKIEEFDINAREKDVELLRKNSEILDLVEKLKREEKKATALRMAVHFFVKTAALKSSPTEFWKMMSNEARRQRFNFDTLIQILLPVYGALAADLPAEALFEMLDEKANER